MIFVDPLEGATLGTVFFPFSCAFLFGWFSQGWEDGFPRGREYLTIGELQYVNFFEVLLNFLLITNIFFFIAGLMAMTYGDAFASIVGRTYGTIRYQVIG